MPEVSVIVPSYNHGPYLAHRLDSIFSQTYREFEVIILDDNSSDNSAEVIRSYSHEPRIAHTIFNAENSGSPFRQWKRGLELAKGKYVWIAESDDYADPRFLEHLVPLMKGNVKLAYCASQNVDDQNRPINALEQWLAQVSPSEWAGDYVADGRDEISRHLSVRNTVANTSSVLMDRASCERYVDSLLTFRYVGDWYLWLHILGEAGVCVAFSAQRLNFFRTHRITTRFGTTSYTYLEEWFRCLHFARQAGLSRKLHPLALRDLREMSLRLPSVVLLTTPVLRSMLRWITVDPVFPRIVYQSLIARIPYWLRKQGTTG